MFLLVFLTSACAHETNLKAKNMVYYRHEVSSRHAFIDIWFVLNDLPRNLTTIYVEKIVFTFQPGWTPPEQYLSAVFANQTDQPRRFAFHRQNFETVDRFDLFVPEALLNVDEWLKREACPFEKIQLQGFSADVEVALPETLEITFPCDLDAVRVCLARDDFWGQCTHYAP
jgi:hypothetical protein